MPVVSLAILVMKFTSLRIPANLCTWKLTFGASSLFLGTIFLVISSAYFHESCKNHATNYLAIQGSLMLALFIIINLSISDLLLPVLASIDLGVWLWGFGEISLSLSTEDYLVDLEFKDVCPEVPYLSAYSYVLTAWVLLGLIVAACISSLLGICFVSICKNLEDDESDELIYKSDGIDPLAFFLGMSSHLKPYESASDCYEIRALV